MAKNDGGYDWVEVRRLLDSLAQQADRDSTDRAWIEWVLRELLDNILLVVKGVRPRLDPLVASVIRERFNPEEQVLLSNFLLCTD
jgi:hypothetical protein